VELIMGTQGYYLYRPSYGALGLTEYNKFDAGLLAADNKIKESYDLIMALSGGGGGGGGGEASTFLDLADTPSSYSGQSLKVLRVNFAADALEFHDVSVNVSSVFGRTGTVVAATNDYTWAQINKTTSNIADITTRPHSSLTGIGESSHTIIDGHISSVANPHSTTFLKLTDTPSSYSGHALKVVRVNADADSMEFATVSVSPGGSDTQVQFNDSGVFNGDMHFTFTKATDTLTVDKVRATGLVGIREVADIATYYSNFTGPTEQMGDINYVLPSSLGSKAYMLAIKKNESNYGVMSWHPLPSSHGSVRAATTENLGSLYGLLTIDGISLVEGERVLVKNQTTASLNGIWIVYNDPWIRAWDFNQWDEIVGTLVIVEEGSTQGDTAWLCTSNQGGTLGSTPISFSQFGAPGGAASTFLDLSDTPSGYGGSSLRLVRVNSGESALEFSTVDSALSGWIGSTSITTLGTIGTGTWDATPITWAKVSKTSSSLADLATKTFLQLSDTPASYAGQALKTPRVNSGETALEFASIGVPGGSNTHVQFNDSGIFGGDADLTWNKATDTFYAKVLQIKDPWADIRSYGADGTAVNDSAALTSALAASKNVYVPPGTWLINATKTIRTGTHLFGVPGQSILKAASTLSNSASMLVNETPDTFTDVDITIEGITFDGNSSVLTDRSASLLDFNKVTNLRINLCTFQNDSYIGLNFGGCRKSSVMNSYFTNIVKPSGTPTGPRFHSYSTTNCEDISLINNIFHSMDSINFSPIRGRVIGNHFSSMRESAIFMSAGTAGAPRDVSIIGNVIDTTTAVAGSASGMELAGDYLTISSNVVKNCASNGIVITDANHFIISNNNVYSCYDGLGILAITKNIANGIVTGNRIYNNTTYGIYIQRSGSYTINSINVTGNDLTNAGLSAIWGTSGGATWGTNCVRANNLGTTTESGTFCSHTTLSNVGSLTHTVIDSYLNQAVKTTSDVTHNILTLTNALYLTDSSNIVKYNSDDNRIQFLIDGGSVGSYKDPTSDNFTGFSMKYKPAGQAAKGNWIEIGAADSGGSGYRMLRVPN